MTRRIVLTALALALLIGLAQWRQVKAQAQFHFTTLDVPGSIFTQAFGGG